MGTGAIVSKDARELLALRLLTTTGTLVAAAGGLLVAREAMGVWARFFNSISSDALKNPELQATVRLLRPLAWLTSYTLAGLACGAIPVYFERKRWKPGSGLFASGLVLVAVTLGVAASWRIIPAVGISTKSILVAPIMLLAALFSPHAMRWVCVRPRLSAVLGRMTAAAVGAVVALELGYWFDYAWDRLFPSATLRTKLDLARRHFQELTIVLPAMGAVGGFITSLLCPTRSFLAGIGSSLIAALLLAGAMAPGRWLGAGPLGSFGPLVFFAMGALVASLSVHVARRSRQA